MDLALQLAQVPQHTAVVDGRVVMITGIAIVLGVISAFVAQLMLALIGLITTVCFFGRVSPITVSAVGNHLGLWIVLVPVGGALIIGCMARFGHEAIRGDGIPEAMEKVLTHKSRIAPRITWLKPLSAAISIGTGGPFGAEGPVISTGGALGSFVGQILSTTAAERKTLLAAGAAAGVAATFGTPIAAVLLAVEVLLFEFRPRSIVPVALATAAAAVIRITLTQEGAAPAFAMPDVLPAGEAALAIYILLGALVGVASVGVTRGVHAVEHAFEHLPIHWMWWPAIGAVVVGLVGYYDPRTLGVGYDNINHILAFDFPNNPLRVIALLSILKLVSWTVSLGSGTSGGTLAPLFTIGGGLGAIIGAGAAWLLPWAHVDVRIAALVGMSAMFAGASRAMLFSLVFGFEATHQANGLLPLLGGCAAAYLVSCLMMRGSLMTEKMERRGVRAPFEYEADFLAQVPVRTAMTTKLVTLRADDTLLQVKAWIESGVAGSSHQGFPVLDDAAHLVGVVTRRDLMSTTEPPTKTVREMIRRPPIVVYDDCSLREAADHMVNHDVGRLPVISRRDPSKVVGVLTRSDLLSAHRRRLSDDSVPDERMNLAELIPGRTPKR